MYPGFLHWRRQQRERHAGEACWSGGGPSIAAERTAWNRPEPRVGHGWEEAGGRRQRGWEYAYAAGGEDPGSLGGGAFGVRRPLRFLAYKLELTDSQVGELARILDELKTERAQAAVDHRRALSAFADAVAGEAFDSRKAEAGAAMRLASAERLRNAVSAALSQIHGLLEPPQRARFAYLIRTGTLSL